MVLTGILNVSRKYSGMMRNSEDLADPTTSEDQAAQTSTSGIRSFFSARFHRRADNSANDIMDSNTNTDDMDEEHRPVLPRVDNDGSNAPPVGYGTNNDDDGGGFGGAISSDARPPERPGTPTPSDVAQQEPELDEPPPPIVNPEDLENEEEAVQSLTQRLRCLFTVLTLPIIPIGTALSVLLLFVLYAAFVTDLHRECSAPLHGYAIVSLVLFIYAPNHRAVKFHLFHYSRERDGPVRPRAVRMYDQMFQTMCLLYVYGGMTLIQSCADDMTTLPVDGGDDTRGGDGGESAGKVAAEAVAGAVGLGEQVSAASQDSETAVATTISTCAATCPALYASTKTFVTTLEIFTIVLILPLLCLPCIYIWVVRRASAVTALAEFGRGRRTMGDDDDGYGGRPYTALEILNGMDSVTFVDADGPNSGLGGGSNKVKVVTLARGASLNRRSSSGGLGDMEEGRVESQISLPPSRMPSYRDREDVRECCICMTEFRVSDHDLPEDLAQLACNSAVMSAIDDPHSIVRTKCGHFFHRSCLGGWLGGQWSEGGNGNNSNMQSRRARRRACPLCREDLAPGDLSARATSTRSSIPDRVIEESTALLGDPVDYNIAS